jgi:methylase of polypeptide subunit release factors
MESLMDHLEGYEAGRYLDMGCGSGVCSIVSAAAGWNVCSADKNPRALALTRRNLELNGSSSHLFLTDLFSGIPESYRSCFDLISFNPPDLPIDIDDLPPMDRTFLFGGRCGAEIASDFLLAGMHYLAPGGFILAIAPRNGMDMLERTALMGGLELSSFRVAGGSDEGLRSFYAYPRKTC